MHSMLEEGGSCKICVSELSNTAQEKVVKSEQMARDARQRDENKIVK